MSYDQRSHHDPAGPPARHGGGVPDALLVGTLATLLGLTALTWTSAGLAGWVSHGSWPDGVTFTRTAHAMRSLLTAPGDIPAAWPQADPDALPNAGLMWLAFLAQVALLFGAALWGMIRLAHWRARRARPHDPAPDPAPAAPGWPEQQAAAVEQPPPAPRRDPQPLAGPAPAAMPVPGVQVPAPAPPPRQDHDPAAAVLDAPEGLLVLDPLGQLWSRTARLREARGPIHVYDPGHATDAPVRLRWAPQRGCEDMTVARSRAAALLAPVRPAEPIFRLDGESAETLLRCYLHAAALSGEPFPQIHRWAGGKSPGEPGKILRTHSRAAGGASMELESTLATHPGRRDAALALITRALSGLDQLHIRQSCTPGRADALALDNIAGEGGTLYVVGDHRETAGLRGALVDAMSTAAKPLTVLDGSRDTPTARG